MFENSDLIYIANFLNVRQRNHLKQCGTLSKASTISGDKNYRGDYILWLDEKRSTIERELFTKLNLIKARLNENLLGIKEVEAHIAYYPPGTSYGKHFDSIKKNNKRVVSVVTYLNENWMPEHGGQLRLYHRNSIIDVPPIPEKTVLFLSSEVEHEVLETNAGRWSIAAWFKR